ncbi:MAG: response regulator [Kangiellaceae bacterium]|nr:response regulator [Kangiellaceae bacterium]
MPESILIVEDEIKLANVLVDYFNLTVYKPHVIHNGDEVIPWVKDNRPAAILLDLMLPVMGGIQICTEIRKFSDVPILMVTAKADEIDRLLGLELGADDYICKPYSPREVVARVKAVLRRTEKTSIQSDTLQLDEDRLMVEYFEQHVSLTSVEFRLLKPLAISPERIFSRAQLMKNMYSDQRIVNDRTIDSHIKKLRKKLSNISNGKDWIQSVYGTGYRLVP